MFSRFFIDRPIFASVLSIAITLAGGLAVWNLPLAQYPPVTPPTVQVNCNYPGASCQVVAETVAAPIEQEVNGVEKMLYMASQCTNDGTYSLTVTFEHGVNLNLAQVLVQNRVNLALPKLPLVLRQTGVTTRKMSPDILLSVNVQSPRGTYDQLYLSNYALLRLRDELLRLEGVGDIFISGQRDYSMRIWVDPEKLSARSLTAGDVVRAIRQQNAQIACGQIGQQPSVPGQETQLTLTTLGRLKTPEQFGDIILRVTRDGRILRIKDVARVELGAKSQDILAKVDGKATVGLIIFQLPDANALEVAGRIHAKMDELAQDFPDDLIYQIQYDTTPYTRDCIHEVVKALRDATLLVAFVVLLFLQNWRSALIPLIAVPVAIIGTFAIMAVMGFSLNNLTLFGLVLAIGIVVDDAIVVVEAVEHHIEQGLAPREATLKAMSQVSGPVIAVGLVLSAVFVPCAFISGITGQFFRQFALTIAGSTLISTFNSLTLSPALAALLLRRRVPGEHNVLPRLFYAVVGGGLAYRLLGPGLGSWIEAGGVFPPERAAALAAAAPWAAAALGTAVGGLVGPLANLVLGWLFGLFNRGFDLSARGYTRGVSMLLRVSVLVLVVYGGLLVMTYMGFKSTPKGFIPSQDMGYLMVSLQLPDAASAERTRSITDRVRQICQETQGVKHTVSQAGQSFLIQANASNFGSMFVILDNFSEREEPGLSAEEIAARLRKELGKRIPEAEITVAPPPPVRGVGRTGGFKLFVEDRESYGPTSLQQQADRVAELGRQQRRRLPGLDELSPEDRGLAEKQGTCPVSGQRLGSLGTPCKISFQGRPVFLCADEYRQAWDQQPEEYAKKIRESPALLVVMPNVFRANAPQLYQDVNRVQCETLGVSLGDLFSTLQIYLGSLYVNDFNLFGRTWQVVVQADAQFRNQVDAARQLKVRNSSGGMVPVGAVAEVREISGPMSVARYNMYPAAAINGTKGPMVSSREAIDLMAQILDRELPPGMKYEWTELAFLELQAGHTAMIIFGLAVIMVFLVLAAQYESWSLPLAVILVVPMCLLSAITGVTAVPTALEYLQKFLQEQFHLTTRLAGTNVQMDINIFTQIGFVVLVGLASKNAILIVEFAKRQRESGASRRDATLAACRLRLRPIVMTSFAFILGVVPLLIANGAGAEMRRTLGTAVFSGMLGVTLFGIFLTPVFFSAIDWLGSTRLFHSRGLQLAANIVLMILTFGWLLVLIRLLARRRGSPEPAEPLDEVET